MHVLYHKVKFFQYCDLSSVDFDTFLLKINMEIVVIKEEFGKRVRELRKQTGLSQEKFALQVDLDRTYIASIENGKRNVSLENIEKLARGFGITISEMFKGVD